MHCLAQKFIISKRQKRRAGWCWRATIMRTVTALVWGHEFKHTIHTMHCEHIYLVTWSYTLLFLWLPSSSWLVPLLLSCFILCVMQGTIDVPCTWLHVLTMSRRQHFRGRDTKEIKDRSYEKELWNAVLKARVNHYNHELKPLQLPSLDQQKINIWSTLINISS